MLGLLQRLYSVSKRFFRVSMRLGRSRITMIGAVRISEHISDTTVP